VPLLTWFNRLAIAVAGILGAAGVAAAVGATHTGDQAILGPLALIALTQAPAVLALGLFAGSGRIVRNTYIEIIDVFGILKSWPQRSPQLCAAVATP
jgi:uncharacterized membrane protein YgdD (TMEM256/DUF423 family)